MNEAVALVVRAVLTLVAITALCVLAWIVVDHNLNSLQQRIIDMIVGALIATVTLSMGWWFGSSKGSSDKTAILKNGRGSE